MHLADDFIKSDLQYRNIRNSSKSQQYSVLHKMHKVTNKWEHTLTIMILTIINCVIFIFTIHYYYVHIEFMFLLLHIVLYVKNKHKLHIDIHYTDIINSTI